MEAKYVPITNLKRVQILLQEVSTQNIYQNVETFSKKIANLLDSLIEAQIMYNFPRNNLTYIAVLSTSHIAISTYFDDPRKYIDIEIAWCSNKDVGLSEIIRVAEESLKGKTLRATKQDYLQRIVEYYL